MNPLTLCLLFAAALFSLGLAAALTRSNAILVLLGIELMLNGANVSFIAFWKFSPNSEAMTGVMFVLFAIAVAAAEAAVGLALIIAVYRHRKSVRVQDANQLRG